MADVGEELGNVWVELASLGIGIWARAVVAPKKIKHDRYLHMISPPGQFLYGGFVWFS
jgi:hypothetical protein